jgi:hypothetical protein
MRIRHYGFLANRCKRENLLKYRQLLDVSLKFTHIPELTYDDSYSQPPPTDYWL